MAFYELFTEIMHYYDSNVIPDKELVDTQAFKLKTVLEIYKI